MSVRNAAVLAWAVAATLCAGCAPRAYDWPDGAMPVYSQAIPVYPKSDLDDAMGGDYYGDTEQISETLTWWFKTEDSQDEVAEWYAQKLPAATRSKSEDGEEIEFTFAPPGGEPGEKVVVRVGEKQFRITEETKPGKHKQA